MTTPSDLLAGNRAWARRRKAEDPRFFQDLSRGQSPPYLWIGCADSRVPASVIAGLPPGELFVHRNVANLVPEDDDNALSVLQYAVDALKVEHVIVCGHYGCGGVRAVLDDSASGRLDRWLSPLHRVRKNRAKELEEVGDDEERWKRLCEMNVEAQVEAIRSTPTVRDAWSRGQSLAIHGWIYDLEEGLLEDLEMTMEEAS